MEKDEGDEPEEGLSSSHLSAAIAMTAITARSTVSPRLAHHRLSEGAAALSHCLWMEVTCSGPCWIRTNDLRIMSPLL